MGYRKEAGSGADEAGRQLKGWKTYSGASMAINNHASRSDILRKIKEIRGGIGANNGVYSVNGYNCYHTHVGGSLAIAWRLENQPGDGQYVIVEALMEHHGRGNDYRVL
ncbi:hypothetical protein [Vitiosangium sp. GDMCC 1.1324]|uniref:hypothetical protein n=1 Tax=Vitiosangium sp. (strain GDMCC 1.1324) TaxID=2138576 RepID=UPI000D36990E|nr:hypothetical protein [Vitiosangium sp. GDMCC 1.1324]PTL75575.1 hypothetical protein DAT35_54150 [Vitiosangium sp. GDMCC 1.1324]